MPRRFVAIWVLHIILCKQGDNKENTCHQEDHAGAQGQPVAVFDAGYDEQYCAQDEQPPACQMADELQFVFVHALPFSTCVFAWPSCLGLCISIGLC